ncbi:MAG: ATP-binding cassette, subfamily bacterial [Acidobacteriota bacterium]|jgi:ABC-type bacteriocin/lantibiotic exporter with double-glycine peptidase domain|nr:ATP-binding cassette, subfamily bacterial [Acidobacteriota bacterium]
MAEVAKPKTPETPGGTGEPEKPSLAARFPALAALRWGRRRHIPFIQQTTATDCGAASLAMVLGYLGKAVTLSEVRESTGVSRHGTNAMTLLEAARHFGLRGRGVQIAEIEDLQFLDPGAILHWRFSHFLVFDRLEKDGAWVVDPASGRQFLPRSELDRSFTGIALVFERGEDFEEAAATPKGVMRYLSRLLAQSGLLTRVLVTSIFMQVFALAVPLLTGLIVDRVVPHGDLHLLTVLAVGALGLIGFKLLATLVRSFLLLHLRTRLDAQMSLEFMDHLVELPFLFFQQRSAGDLVMRLNSNSTIREILTSGALSGALDGTMVGLYLILVLAADLKMGLLVAFLGALRVALFLLARRRQHDLMSRSLQTQARARSYEFQLLAGIETVKAAGAEREAVQRWSDLFVQDLNVSLDRGRLDAMVNSVLDTLSVGSPIIILLYGAQIVIDGGMSLGTMLALSALAAGFLGPLTTLIQTAFQLQLLGSYLERANDVLDTPREREGDAGRKPGALAGRITLDEVTFRYAISSPPAVREATVDVPPGRMIAVVGSSGSGKSTLAGLLAGLYKPDSGRILYDGADMAEIDLHWLRSQLGFVAQDSFLFGASIRANIALTDPAMPLARVIEAAEMACIHADIMALPMRYDTLLADGGASLSGGQRQRLALARALVRRPRVLVLDEATSALDAITEQKVHANLATLRSTRIIIAHRLSTVRDADLILVMDQGRVVERGTHDELLVRGGPYRDLVAAQLNSPDGHEAAPDLVRRGA